MTHFFTGHKRKLSVVIAVAMAILFFIYLYAFSRPGVWHENTFLYHQKDGAFRGSDVFAEYELQLTRESAATQISFRVNDTVNSYSVLYTPIVNSRYWNIEIIENGISVFRGKTISTDPLMLIDENENLDIHISASTTSDFFEVPTTDELFPTNAKLASWAINGTHGIRGNLVMLILIFVFTLFLALDIAFPRLFFFLEHGLDVTGGEPSEFFLFCQKAGRVFLAIGIIICVILSFTTH